MIAILALLSVMACVIQLFPFALCNCGPKTEIGRGSSMKLVRSARKSSDVALGGIAGTGIYG
ncbi:MAG TPA: hypothetical protein VIY90_18775 [Steroidobacteraceae bacterium]